MLNFGLTDLILIAPRDEFPSSESFGASAGAGDIIFPQTKIFDNLPTALAPFHYIIATSVRPRDQAIAVLTIDQSLAAVSQQLAHHHHTADAPDHNPYRWAVMFGPERTGLTNDDLSYAHHILSFPTNPDFASLNLAGSVLLFSYLWFSSSQINDNKTAPMAPTNLMTADTTMPTSTRPDPWGEAASFADRDYFINRLLAALEKNGFFKSPPMQPSLSRNIRQMFTHANFSAQEIKTLQGILTNLLEKK